MPAPVLQPWVKEFKGYFWTTDRIEDILGGTGHIEFTPWFNYSDFGMPWDEFTFVYNYKNVTVGASNLAVGVGIAMQWDVGGEYIDTETALDGEDAISDAAYTSSIHRLVIDKDLALTSDINVALGPKFRFKLTYDANSIVGGYTDEDVIHMAIVPHNGG